MMQTIKLFNFSLFQPKIVISANCGVEPNRNVLYKPMLDEGLEIATHKPKHCIIYNRPMVQSSHYPLLHEHYHGAIPVLVWSCIQMFFLTSVFYVKRVIYFHTLVPILCVQEGSWPRLEYRGRHGQAGGLCPCRLHGPRLHTVHLRDHRPAKGS